MQYVSFSIFQSQKHQLSKADKPGKTNIFRMKTPKLGFRKTDPNQISYLKQKVLTYNQEEIPQRLETFYRNLI